MNNGIKLNKALNKLKENSGSIFLYNVLIFIIILFLLEILHYPMYDLMQSNKNIYNIFTTILEVIYLINIGLLFISGFTFLFIKKHN